MTGGLLNGALPYSDQFSGDNPAIPQGTAQPAPELSENYYPIVVPTVLNLSRDMLQYWKSVTCFFNKWWFPERDRVTLPFCFFNIVKYSETHKASVSEKRVILYEPPEVTDAAVAAIRDPVRPGLMQTIADNAVISPKEYKLEIVVPFLPFGNNIRQGVDMMRTVTDIFINGEQGISGDSAAYILAQMADASTFTERARMALANQSAVFGSEHSHPLDAESMVNKNSLDAMFERGNIIQFKTWMGFDYKYVIILDKTVEKRGTEDNVWRGSITLREMPVLSLAPVVGDVKPINRTWAVGTTDASGRLALGQERVSRTVPAFKALVGAAEEE